MPEPSQQVYQLRGHLKHCENLVTAAEDALRAARAYRAQIARAVRKAEREEGLR